MIPGLLAEAWRLWRRHRPVLLPATAPWLFLPPFALALLVAAPPSLPAERDSAVAEAWAEAFVAWAGAQGYWYLLAHLVAMIGTGSVYALLLRGVEVRGAIGMAARAVPRLALASVLTGPIVLLGLSLWLVPGLYAMARLSLVAPAIVVERRSVLAAIGESVRRTQGHGLNLMMGIGLPFLFGWLGGQPFLAIDQWQRAGGANPVVLALADAGVGAVAFAAALAQALVVVVAYRRLPR